MALKKIEKHYEAPVAGVDEAGRGPWAGPVVAAAVIFDPAKKIPRGIDDSKKLTREVREDLFEKINERAYIGLGICEVEEIDTLNILGATKKAMTLAVMNLSLRPAMVLVDGNRLPAWEYKSEALIGGDALCVSIAAASIIAKVTRDRIMQELAKEHPHYGWESNVGYGTRAHQDGLASHGVCRHHRKSYAPIRAILEGRRIEPEDSEEEAA